jgi:hypothetical protein
MSVVIRKPFSVGVVSLCVLAGVLLFMSAPVFAAEAPKVEEQWVTKVSGSSATLWAKVNPGEAATTYRFEYATSEAALLAGEGEVFPAPPASEGSVGEGDMGVVVQAHPQDLQSHTSYWYRVVATNADGVTPGCQTSGSCQTFMTQPPGGQLVLPDGRAWELVSPPPAGAGATATVTNFSSDGEIIEAAEDGGAFTFLTIGATEAAPQGQADESQILSVRAPGGGWSSKDIASPHEHASGASDDSGQEYRFFSPDLSVALVEPAGTTTTGTNSIGATPLSPGASERTVYVRDDQPLAPDGAERTVYGEAEREAYPGAEGGLRPLVTGCPLEPAPCDPRVREDADVPAGTKFSEGFASDEQHPSFEGATADLSHAIVRSEVPLTAETPEEYPTDTGVFGLWEWTTGREPREQLQIVSVLPDGEQSQDARLGTSNGDDARGAVSDDGSRIVWSAGKHLYLRDVSREQTVQIDEPEKEVAVGGNYEAVFQFANSDGSEVFFTDRERLTKDSTAGSTEEGDGEGDLYECEIVEVEEAGKRSLKCDLSDLTVDPNYNAVTKPREHAGVNGVVDVGSNEDTDLYFLALGKLTNNANTQGAQAKVGDPNVYLLHFDGETSKWEEPVFITTLSQGDSPDFDEEEAGSVENLEGRTSRVSPDGEYLAFMSELPLTGYDNRDASSGEPDEELYLYRAPSSAVPAGRLVCASCNPSDARPHGVLDGGSGYRLLVDPSRLWQLFLLPPSWLAASVPGWTNMNEGVARYQSRYLSDSGRLFFDSSDDLVPQATNGLMDVYEYEPVGVGGKDGCETSSSTFDERSGGCVALVSSGSSGEESAFLDASESGEDVFFLSSAQLVGADTGSGLAVYDAHVCSAALPCPVEASAAPLCATADACRAAPAPQPSVFGAPSSATFAGAGNVTPSPEVAVKPQPKTVKCPKGKHLSHGKCVKNKHKKKKTKARKSVHTDRGAGR